VTKLTHGSLFSGIGGFDLAFTQNGFEPLWCVEIEPFCRAVLKTHFPNTEIFNNVKEVGAHNLKPVDVLTGGFPCQDVSVAGKRAGLAGSRTGLFWEALRIVQEVKPSWLVLENVPGLLSSNKGLDFTAVLNALAELGQFKSISFRCLDSRYMGVAQRRRRVFIICGPRTGDSEAVLFEREGRSRNSESGEASWEGVASAIKASPGGVGNQGGNGTSIAHESGQGWWTEGVGTLRTEGENRPSRPSHVIYPVGDTTLESGVGQYHRIYGSDGPSPTLQSTGTAGGTFSHAIAYDTNLDIFRMQAFGDYADDGTASALKTRDYKDATDLIVGTSPVLNHADEQREGLQSIHTGSSSASDGSGTGAWESGRGCDSNSVTDVFTFESRFTRNGRGAPDDIVPPLKTAVGHGDTAPLVGYSVPEPLAFNWQDNHCFRAEEGTTNPLRVSQTEAVAYVSVPDPISEKRTVFVGLNQGGNDEHNGNINHDGAEVDSDRVRDFTGISEIVDHSRPEVLADQEGKEDQESQPVDVPQVCGPLGHGSGKQGWSVNAEDAASGKIIAVRSANTGSNGWGILQDGTTHTLDSTGSDFVCSDSQPSEEEKFPLLPKGMDSPRYKALGNAVTVSTVSWIANRIRARIAGEL
jgi:site-specific DNA-cytosine methylase